MTFYLLLQKMAHHKPLLIPWLRDQIDSGRYPGVQWTNPEQTEFSIPWKHALRQDSSNTDVLIFKVSIAEVYLDMNAGAKQCQDLAVHRQGVKIPSLCCCKYVAGPLLPFVGLGSGERQQPASGRPLNLEEKLPQRPSS